jgi:sterol desaturase/sphingolipid hydroxylase (fatty acid hydroxylase superfamily)
MSIDLNTAPEPSASPTPGLAPLIGGILVDLQKLLQQQMEHFQQEFRDDLRKTQETVLAFGLAGVFSLVGGVLLIVAAIGLLAHVVPAIPWWGWSGLLGGGLLVPALVLFYLGRRKLASFNPLPDLTYEAARENVQWLKNRVTTS